MEGRASDMKLLKYMGAFGAQKEVSRGTYGDLSWGRR